MAIDTEHVTISTPTQQAGRLETDDSTEVAFDIRIEEGYHLNSTPFFKITFTDHPLEYKDFGFVQYDDLLYDIMAANNIQISFGGDGTVGFTDQEKITSLQAGREYTTVRNTDASGVVGSGPYTLSPGATITVGFVCAFGDDLQMLHEQMATARQQVPFSVSPTGISTETPEVLQTELYQNYPNPFLTSTEIAFYLSKASYVKLTVYDILGRKVEILVDRALTSEQTHQVTFNGEPYSSGVYFIQLITDQNSQVIPMTLVK